MKGWLVWRRGKMKHFQLANMYNVYNVCTMYTMCTYIQYAQCVRTATASTKCKTIQKCGEVDCLGSTCLRELFHSNNYIIWRFITFAIMDRPKYCHYHCHCVVLYLNCAKVDWMVLSTVFLRSLTPFQLYTFHNESIWKLLTHLLDLPKTSLPILCVWI